MIENATHYLFIQHSHETLLVSIAFYLIVLLLINAETIAAALKHGGPIGNHDLSQERLRHLQTRVLA